MAGSRRAQSLRDARPQRAFNALLIDAWMLATSTCSRAGVNRSALGDRMAMLGGATLKLDLVTHLAATGPVALRPDGRCHGEADPGARRRRHAGGRGGADRFGVLGRADRGDAITDVSTAAGDRLDVAALFPAGRMVVGRRSMPPHCGSIWAAA
ncbi:hypothetical protein [Dankookia sp. P2]|uniref:hypothetical protein n=1 Tax=Dankookia sp. P2 TaxID=3423955 RepID=UPI003D6733D7